MNQYSQQEKRHIAANKYRIECANASDPKCECGQPSSEHRYGTSECLGCDSCKKFKREMKNADDIRAYCYTCGVGLSFRESSKHIDKGHEVGPLPGNWAKPTKPRENSDDGFSDADVHAKAQEMFKDSWDNLSSKQQDQVYAALEKEMKNASGCGICGDRGHVYEVDGDTKILCEKHAAEVGGILLSNASTDSRDRSACPKGKGGEGCDWSETKETDSAYWYKCDRCGRTVTVPKDERKNASQVNYFLQKWMSKMGGDGYSDDVIRDWVEGIGELSQSEKERLIKLIKQKDLENASSDQIRAVKAMLSNDESSSDAELVDHFVNQIGLTKSEALAWVAKRDQYLKGMENAENATCKCGHTYDQHSEDKSGKKGASGAMPCDKCGCMSYYPDRYFKEHIKGIENANPFSQLDRRRILAEEFKNDGAVKMTPSEFRQKYPSEVQEYRTELERAEKHSGGYLLVKVSKDNGEDQVQTAVVRFENASAYIYVGDKVKLKSEPDTTWTVSDFAGDTYVLRGPKGSRQARLDQLERVSL